MHTGLLSYKVFLSGIKRLEAAFRVQPLSDASLKIYYEKLSSIDDLTFEMAVETAISEEDFFPSIAYLRSVCGISHRYDAAGRVLQQL